VRPPCKIIALLTDFGYEDPYVASMKGVALSICPDVKLIDITHSIPSFDIETGAFTLLASYKYFPQGTIFVAVVDPGVGGPRRPLLIVTRNYYFIGPDNGLLTAAAEDDGIEAVIKIENELYFRKPVSASFHGRDIFMPTAAWLACGVAPDTFGSRQPIESIVRSSISMYISTISADCVEVRVLHIDKFGNVILSQRYDSLENALGIKLGDKVYVRYKGAEYEALVAKVFSVASEKQLVLYKNSFDFAELAVNRGSAKDLMGVRKGDSIIICRK
jgi:hypothetical protein